jgi:hypothetical protein
VEARSGGPPLTPEEYRQSLVGNLAYLERQLPKVRNSAGLTRRLRERISEVERRLAEFDGGDSPPK